MALSLHKEVRQVGKKETASLIYHDIFDYPLTVAELIHWQAGKNVINHRSLIINHKKGFYYLKGREGNILKRLAREKTSVKKIKTAQLAGTVLARIPMVKMVGITGALAMKSADKDSDIDLMIIASKGTLWTTRLLVYCLLLFVGFKLRRAGVKDQKDKLCLNMWFDESDLIWRRRNIFTAHEIAQIVPIVNKNNTYEKLLQKNRWILEYWPKSVGIKNYELGIRESKRRFAIIHYSLFIIRLIELFAFKVQYRYMRSKITREVVTPTRAVFHPFDWSKHIKARWF
ncbi:hypothetical protein HYT59_02205 [Candidatus Woesebacteria bacterium]|nr:hypothetical protein [Candidatus Woesebacteria bacterium]